MHCNHTNLHYVFKCQNVKDLKQVNSKTILGYKLINVPKWKIFPDML